jgi:hypothetical protein
MKVPSRRNVIVTALAGLVGVLFFWRRRSHHGHAAAA